MWQQFWAHVQRHALAWGIAYLAAIAVVYLVFVDGIALHWWLLSVAALLAPGIYYEFCVVSPADSVFGRWRGKQRNGSSGD